MNSDHKMDEAGSIIEPSTSAEHSCINQTRFPSIPQLEILHFIHDPKERIWNGPFTFVHMADPQFGLIEKHYEKKPNPGWEEEIRITETAIEKINQLRPIPKFVMIGGDMLDQAPENEEAQKIREEQYKDFLKTIHLLDPQIKIIVCAGNHDVGDVASPGSIKIYHEQFGPDFFSFWVGGVKFTVLNSQYWKCPEAIPSHFQDQQTFISSIHDPSAKYSVVFQHIPFFISDPDEENVSYLNIDKEHRFPVLDELEKAGVNAIFCGHYHRNAGGFYKGMEEVVTSALCNPLGEDPCGFRIVHVDEDKIRSEYVEI